jgi:hypothetical protein
MNQLVTVDRQVGGAMASFTAAEVKARVQHVQQVMKMVMKDKTHYGVIPGAGERKSLFKAGAEVLCMTFHIAPDFRVEDLSDGDSIRYRVTCVGSHQGTGVVLGQGMGEASSNEEKYKWRAAVCAEEFDATYEDRKRIKWRRGYNRGDAPEKIQQIRTEPADIANTVLKMACKRAHVAMTINTTAASDIFTQDLEDMPAEVRDTVVAAESPRGKPATDTPQPAAASAASTKPPVATEKQIAMVRKRIDSSGVPEAEFLKHFQLDSVEALPFASVDAALLWIKSVSP